MLNIFNCDGDIFSHAKSLTEAVENIKDFEQEGLDDPSVDVVRVDRFVFVNRRLAYFIANA